MSQFIDYAALKRDVTIEQVASWLGLDLKKHGNQLRGPCPLSGGGERALTITLDYPNKDGSVGRFYCFAKECRKGGDLIELVAKVRNVKPHEAAEELRAVFQTPAAPQPSKLPAGGLSYLEAEHDAVQALGLSPDAARRLGVGYAGKGIMRGRVCFPLRGEDGTLIAYCGYAAELEPVLKFPVKFL